MKKKKLILFDMDGTLIDWRQGIDKPTKQMFEAFQKLREHGFFSNDCFRTIVTFDHSTSSRI